MAIREQMRQEAQERKALEEERKKVEKEESKYHTEIEKLKEQLTQAKENELEQLNARILELQSQLADVIVKKEEISNLANGKAGNVYVISNLGSFGENQFNLRKIVVDFLRVRTAIFYAYNSVLQQSVPQRIQSAVIPHMYSYAPPPTGSDGCSTSSSSPGKYVI